MRIMKKVILFFVVLLGVFLISGCNEVQPTITVEDKNIEVEMGDFYSLNPQVSGLDAPQLSYESTNLSVFTVDNSGIITPVSPGMAYLNITLLNANIGTLKLAVEVLPEGAEDDITPPGNNGDDEQDVNLIISNGNLNIEVDDLISLELLANGSEFLGEIIWVSSNSSVATVDIDGSLLAKAAGTTVVSAVAANSFTTISVTVRNKTSSIMTPTSLVISGSSFVNISETTILTATPNQGVVTGLIWSSSDASKATVNQYGVVTGLTQGVVIISAALASNQTVVGTFSMYVKETSTSGSPITAINISGTNEVLTGNKIKLTVSYTPSTEPATFTFSSSNTSIATVDQAGWVTGVSGGSVLIKATLVGDSEKDASFSVNVIPLPEGITITGASSVSYGQNIVLQALAYPVGASSAVSWSTSNSSIATVDNSGRVTGIAQGSVTITATSLVNNSIIATHQVTVTDAKSITLNPTHLSLNVGANQTITATVFAASLTDKSVVWSSGNSNVATVDSNGKVTGISAGYTIIIAKLNADNTVQSQANVTVVYAPIPTITMSVTSTSLSVGTNKTITATVSNASNTSVTWSTSNASVATVVGGVITGMAAGTATITATSVANTSVKATCAVTVNAVAPGTLTLSADPSATISVGATGYQVYVNDSAGASVSRLECTFSSSNSSVATVSTYGTISALANGTAVITAVHPTKGSGSITLTIGSGGTTPPPPTSGLTVTADPSATMNIGAAGYQIYVRDSAGVSVSRTECTFTTSNSTVASVSTYGTISSYNAGTAVITATHPTKGNGTVTLTVTDGSSSGGTTPPPTSGAHAVVFTFLEKYKVNTTLSQYVRTYGTTTKTETVLGSVNYYYFGSNTVDTSTFYRWHSTAPGRKYITIHCTGNNSATANARANANFLSTSSGASIHYVVDHGKTIYRVCPENSIAWHAGSTTSGLLSGNSYAIGIEMCQNEGNDLFLTWQRTAKLLPGIISRWSGMSGLSAVKQHYNFSYKNCPQELRESGLWTAAFAKMVKAEYEYYTKYKAYSITLKSGNTTYLDNYGHVVKRPTSNLSVSYTITVVKDGIAGAKTYTATIPSSVSAAVTGRADAVQITNP